MFFPNDFFESFVETFTHDQTPISFDKIRFVFLRASVSHLFQANFLGHRAIGEDDFLVKVLDSMGFSAFVADRGPPYRVCDVFDEVRNLPILPNLPI